MGRYPTQHSSLPTTFISHHWEKATSTNQQCQSHVTADSHVAYSLLFITRYANYNETHQSTYKENALALNSSKINKDHK